MHAFTFYSPTKIYFGEHTVEHIAEHVAEYQPSMVLIVYGGGSVKRSGLLDLVKKKLADAGSFVELFALVSQNEEGAGVITGMYAYSSSSSSSSA